MSKKPLTKFKNIIQKQLRMLSIKKYIWKKLNLTINLLLYVHYSIPLSRIQ